MIVFTFPIATIKRESESPPRSFMGLIIVIRTSEEEREARCQASVSGGRRGVHRRIHATSLLVSLLPSNSKVQDDAPAPNLKVSPVDTVDAAQRASGFPTGEFILVKRRLINPASRRLIGQTRNHKSSLPRINTSFVALRELVDFTRIAVQSRERALHE